MTNDKKQQSRIAVADAAALVLARVSDRSAADEVLGAMYRDADREELFDALYVALALGTEMLVAEFTARREAGERDPGPVARYLTAARRAPDRREAT